MSLAPAHPAEHAVPLSRGLAAPVVIMLADGLTLGGVTTWALRLAGSLARGTGGVLKRQVTIVVHDEPPAQPRPIPDGLAGVEVLRLQGLPPLREACGDLRPFIPAYLAVIQRLSRAANAPCIVAPTSLGDAFGIAAAISVTHPELLRVVGWQHSDIAYDTRVLQHYEPLICAFAGVSTHIASRLRERTPSRASDVAWLPYGVDISPDVTCRPSPAVQPGTPDRPLRLIYTGRFEHEQKRIGALLRLPSQLAALGVSHSLTLVGDGPAAEEVERACAENGRRDARATGGVRSQMRRLPAVPPGHVGALLDEADAFLLSSRYEGLSVSMLEAMSRACVPVVTHVASGAADAVDHACNGLLVEWNAGDSDEQLARSLARSIHDGLVSPSSLARLSAAALRTARQHFSLERHAALVSDLFDRAAASPARSWPTSRPCAFTAPGAADPAGGSGHPTGSGTVPASGPRRLRELLRSIAAQSTRDAAPAVVLHGSGRHTIELASVLASSPVPIVAITDDDPARWGARLLGWTVCPPADAAAHGATDVVISSWLHAPDIYARREIYESQGLRVHRLYDPGEPAF